MFSGYQGTMRCGRPIGINWPAETLEFGAKSSALPGRYLGIDSDEYLEDMLLRVAIRTSSQSVNDLTPIEWVKSKNNGKLPKVT